jgi:SAM-dependent methyltransferase
MPNDADDDELCIRGEYERLGADAYYRAHGGEYRNPHEQAIEKALKSAVAKWRPDLSHVLDLAAGSGEATIILQNLGAAEVEGIDPYTADAYERRVGRPCERISFEQVADGALAGRRYSLVVCSFAMHLLDESRLPLLAMQLAMIAPRLWIVTPHKRPRLERAWGWETEDEIIVRRVRIRSHQSTLFVTE